MQQDTIDVIIPAYNAQEFILHAIDSVRSQTYPVKKTIVVDDGSTDRTAEIVRENCANDKSIVYIRQENGGPSSARNRGIKESNADFIALLDADDVWLPTKLTEQIELFRNANDPELGVVYCEYSVIDRSGNLIDSPPISPQLRGDVFDRLLPANRISGSDSGVLIKRQCFDMIGDFDESLLGCEDWDMWLRLAQHYHFDYVQKPLVQIRRHDKNIQLDEYRMFGSYILFFNKWIYDASRTRGVLEGWRRDYAPQMIVSVIKEFPKMELYGRLSASMSPEVKRLASTNILQTVSALLAKSRFARFRGRRSDEDGSD